MPKTRSFSDLRREMLTDKDVADHYVEITIQNSPSDFIAAIQHVADARATLSADPADSTPNKWNKDVITEKSVFSGDGQVDSRTKNPFSMNVSNNFYSFGERAYGSIGGTQS